MAREIVARYPDLALILGHSGGTDAGRREAEDLAGEFPNVFLEWCGSFCSPVTPKITVMPTEEECLRWQWGLSMMMTASSECMSLSAGTRSF